MKIDTKYVSFQIERGYIYLRLFSWEYERIAA